AFSIFFRFKSLVGSNCCSCVDGSCRLLVQFNCQARTGEIVRCLTVRLTTIATSSGGNPSTALLHLSTLSPTLTAFVAPSGTHSRQVMSSIFDRCDSRQSPTTETPEAFQDSSLDPAAPKG